MVQQQVKSKWQHMVGVICLNLTYRKQVKEIDESGITALKNVNSMQ